MNLATTHRLTKSDFLLFWENPFLSVKARHIKDDQLVKACAMFEKPEALFHAHRLIFSLPTIFENSLKTF